VASKNPLGKIKDVALGTLLHPVGTAGKAVDQARGTAALGRTVAGQVTRTAASVAAGTVGGLAKRAGGGASETQPASGTRGDEPNLRPVPSVNEPAHSTGPRAVADPAAESTKNHGDLLAPVADVAKKAPTKKAPAKKAPAENASAKKAAADKTAANEASAKKATAKKAAAKKAPADEAPAKKAAAKVPAKKTATKKTAAKKTTEDPGLLEAQTPPQKLAEQGLDDVTPADVAKVAKKTPTKKTTPVKPVDTASSERPAKKAPTKKPPVKAAPRTAAEVANEEGPELTTPVGTTAAGESALPNTDLQQPGTEPLMDPATVKAAKSEAETMQRAADPDKG
jgi:hypothetical protein